MSNPAGGPQPPSKRPRWTRERKELVAALVALPVLLTAGVYLGGRLSDDGGTGALQPAGGIGTPLVTEAPTPGPALSGPPSTATAGRTPVPPKPTPKPKPRRTAPRAGGPFAPQVTLPPAAPNPGVSPAAPPAAEPPASQPPAAEPPVAEPPVAEPPVAQPPVAQPPVIGPVAPAEPPTAPRSVLGRGSTGDEVRAWQRQMARRGWRIKADGIFGPRTERVALLFQRHKGLLVDGLVGPQTWNAAWRLRVIR